MGGGGGFPAVRAHHIFWNANSNGRCCITALCFFFFFTLYGVRFFYVERVVSASLSSSSLYRKDHGLFRLFRAKNIIIFFFFVPFFSKYRAVLWNFKLYFVRPSRFGCTWITHVRISDARDQDSGLVFYWSCMLRVFIWNITRFFQTKKALRQTFVNMLRK